MTLELLISVRSWDEYQTVTAALDEPARRFEGARVIIDFKETGGSKATSGGPLAPVSPELWRRVAEHAGENASRSERHGRPAVRLSAALGDSESALRLASEVPDQFSFAKMGPEGIVDPNALARRWAEVVETLPAAVSLVPVAYADHQNSGSPTVMQTIQQCLCQGHPRMLIDTFDKSGRSSIDYLQGHSDSSQSGSLNNWGSICQQIRDAGIWVSLAGKIDLNTACRVWNANAADHPRNRVPQCIGIRGAVCDGARWGAISEIRLREWLRWQETANLGTSVGQARSLAPSRHNRRNR